MEEEFVFLFCPEAGMPLVLLTPQAGSCPALTGTAVLFRSVGWVLQFRLLCAPHRHEPGPTFTVKLDRQDPAGCRQKTGGF